MWASAALRSPCPETRHHKSRVLGAEVRSLCLERPSRRVKAGRAAPARQAGSLAMWVLMYIFSYSVSPAATNDRAEWRLLPTVLSRNFLMKNGAERLSLRLKRA